MILCQFALLSPAYQHISPSILIHFWRELYHFLCASRHDQTIIITRAQCTRRAPQAQHQPGNMDQGQQAPPAPPAQPAIAVAPPVLPAPPPPPPVVPATPAPPAFALELIRSHSILDYDNPNSGDTATKLNNKAISPLETKFDGEVDNLVMFQASVCNGLNGLIGIASSWCQLMMGQ